MIKEIADQVQGKFKIGQSYFMHEELDAMNMVLKELRERKIIFKVEVVGKGALLHQD